MTVSFFILEKINIKSLWLDANSVATSSKIRDTIVIKEKIDYLYAENISKNGQPMGIKEYRAKGGNKALLKEYHRKSDSLAQWQINFTKYDAQTYAFDHIGNGTLVGSSFAFLFHDGIYSKEQVFEEIPQAKEYYLKYSKETDSTTNIISDTITKTP
ncbi:MAG: hypothetical protein J6T70_00155 [Bacteroidales bacterium]|nr:hypothetical protein [Bacteroidales bacterium]